MADATSSLPSDPITMMPVSGWPMPLLYPFSFHDVVALLSQIGLALLSVLTFWRRPERAAESDIAVPPAGLTPPPSDGRRSPAYRSPNLGATLQFRFLHVASFLVLLPIIAATRLLPSHWRERHEQSVFVETNYAVLTALGLAFMA